MSQLSPNRTDLNADANWMVIGIIAGNFTDCEPDTETEHRIHDQAHDTADETRNN